MFRKNLLNEIACRVTTFFYFVVSMPETTYSSTVGLSKPVPTKFRPDESTILADAKRATGLSRSELIRRSVRLMGRQQNEQKRYDFLLELVA